MELAASCAVFWKMMPEMGLDYREDKATPRRATSIAAAKAGVSGWVLWAGLPVAPAQVTELVRAAG
jgi:hypothetical protein